MEIMTKLSHFLWALVILGIVMTGSAFAESVRVGVLLPLTGKLARFGEVEQRSFLMALNEINKAGGVNGVRVELIIEDTTGRPDVGRSAIEKLISKDGICVVGGGYSSSVTWAAAAVAQQRHVPFLVNTAAADRITEQGWNYVFRLNAPVSEFPDTLASFLTKVVRIKTVAVLHENSLFARSVARNFAKLCKNIGIKVLLKEGYEAGAVNFKPLLLDVKARKPEMVYMFSNAMEASLLMRQSKELNLNPKLFVGSASGFALPEFQKYAGEAAEYVFSSIPWVPSVPYPGAKKYYNSFVAQYGSSTEYHGAEAYAAMYVIADALKRARSMTPDDVRDALAETDMMTVFGPVRFISYRKKSQQNRLPVFLVQWVDDKIETVWPRKTATTKYVYPMPPWRAR